MDSYTAVWMTSQQYRQLHDELAALRSQRSVEAPDDFMDYPPNRAARPSARQKTHP